MDAIPLPLVLALALAYPAFCFQRWLKRRAAFRDFARTRELRFRGMLPSDKYAPYALFRVVARAVLLHHVVDGQRHGFEIAVFDFPIRIGTQTGVIVSGLPVSDAPAPSAEGELAFDLQDGSLLGYRPRVPIEDISSFVESVISAARHAGSSSSGKLW